MKAVVLRPQFKEGLEIAERICAKSASLPIVQHVLVSAEKKMVRLRATDLQIGVTYQFLGTVEKEGQAVFAPRFLHAALGASLENRVLLEKEDGNLAVVLGEQRLSLKTLDPEEFPLIPSVQGDEVFFDVDTGALCQGLSQVVGMVGQSQVRPEISGVFFVFEKKEMRLVATDSFRLAEKVVRLEKESVSSQSFILPAKTAKELISTLAERTGKTRLYMSPTQAIFDYESIDDPSQLRLQIVSRLIEGEYPHYQDVIPSAQKTRVIIPRDAFLSYVKTAGVFADKTNEVRLTANPSAKKLEFFSRNTEAGEQKSLLSCDIEGEATQVAFNWRFLLDGLVQIKGRNAELGLNGEDGPALLRSAEQHGYRYVLMPIKA